LAKLCSYYGTTNIVEALNNPDCKKAMEQENVARLRDENGVETFQLFHGKMEFCKTEMDFFVEAEMKTEQHFLAEQTRKWNFRFRLMRNFRF
jgi:hypothetical protein